MAFHEGRVTGVGTSTPIADPSVPPPQTAFPENQEIKLFLAHFNAIWADLLTRQTSGDQLSRDAACAQATQLLDQLKGISGTVSSALKDTSRIA